MGGFCCGRYWITRPANAGLVSSPDFVGLGSNQ